jgi:hypothetical protein
LIFSGEIVLHQFLQAIHVDFRLFARGYSFLEIGTKYGIVQAYQQVTFIYFIPLVIGQFYNTSRLFAVNVHGTRGFQGSGKGSLETYGLPGDNNDFYCMVRSSTARLARILIYFVRLVGNPITGTKAHE